MRSPRIRTLRTAPGAVGVLFAAAIAAGLFLRQRASGSGCSYLPASLPLAPSSSLHGLQLDVGRPLVAAETIAFPPGL